jgi:hypothetical protein
MVTSADQEFINIFNECYPFERYIIKEPKPIGNLFDDALLTEIFVPYTEIKPITANDGSLITHTSVNIEEIYVKIKGPAGEMRFGYYDFEEHIREGIRYIFINDLGQYEYESLYVDHEDGEPELIVALETQKKLIQEKYGKYEVKKSLRDNLV